MEPPWKRGTKVYSGDLGHKIAARLIYGKKNLQHFLPKNQWADCDETWYVASELKAVVGLFQFL